MRKCLALTILIGSTVLVVAQDEPPVIPPRYGVSYVPDGFPQVSAKESLSSSTRAIEKGKFEYLAAHLIDPKFIDDRVSERAAQIEVEVDLDLRAMRMEQRKSPTATAPEYRLPNDPNLFDARVKAEARLRAFKLVVKDIRDTLTEHPDHVNAFKKFSREGQFLDSGDTASASLRDAKDRQLFFRRIDGRWYVENRQQPEIVEKK